MADLFRARRVSTDAGIDLQAYLVESTASCNVEGPTPAEELERTQTASGLIDLTPNDAIDQIVDHLISSLQKSPENGADLVLMIHGFNNPYPVALDRFNSVFQAVLKDDVLRKRDHMVCVGYRWPSEQIFSILGSTRPGVPSVVVQVAFISLAAFLVSAVILLSSFLTPPYVTGFLRVLCFVTFVLSLLLMALPFAAVLERALVYFRDIYRATQYGVPDFVEVVRQIDKAFVERTEKTPEMRNKVRLSVIGHSMGAFVVTSVVRILTDVFNPATMPDSLEESGAKNRELSPNVGRTFRLSRLVLVSPDIPAETLMSGRSNFLASSLVRFEEAYLFSNAGDVVLRYISSLANSFSFPTSERRFGQRLGNAEVDSIEYGVRDVTPKELPGEICVGERSLAQLGLDIKQGTAPAETESGMPSVASNFTYIDCTDYREPVVTADGKASGKFKSFLSYSMCVRHLSVRDYWGLLIHYVMPNSPKYRDVHSGYFDGPFTLELITRLACMGWSETVASLANTHTTASQPAESPNVGTGLDALCREKKIQILRAPNVKSAVRKAAAAAKS